MTNDRYVSRVENLIELQDTWAWIWRSSVYQAVRWVLELAPRFVVSVVHSLSNLVSGVPTTNKLNESLEILWRSKNYGIMGAAGEDEDAVTEVGVRKRGTESCVLPWPHFATGNMLLRKLLDTNDTDFFAPTIVVALVQHKWRSFGRPRFTQDLFVYIVSLILMVTASIINRKPGVLEKLHTLQAYPNMTGVNMTAILAEWSSNIAAAAADAVAAAQDVGEGVSLDLDVLETGGGVSSNVGMLPLGNLTLPLPTIDLCAANKLGCRYSHLMAIIMGFFIFKSAVYDINREWLQFRHGPRGYYFKDRFNVVDWLRIPITLGTACIYFTQTLAVVNPLLLNATATGGGGGSDSVGILSLEEDEVQTHSGHLFQAWLSMSVYLYWLGLCQHLQPLPGIGPVVRIYIYLSLALALALALARSCSCSLSISIFLFLFLFQLWPCNAFLFFSFLFF